MQVSAPITPTLWRNPSFVRLWVAKTISGIGSSITATAIPLAAAFALNATPGQMAALVFAGQLPDLLFGLIAGVWVDRVRRRPILIGTDLGRAVLLAVIPIAAVFDVLSMPLLWFVAFGSAALTLLFTLASVAVLPTIVHEDQLVEANSKLHMSEAVLGLVGPSGAGVLIQLVTAPKAIIADVVSFLVSALSLGGIASAEPKPPIRQSGFAAIRQEVWEGLYELIRTPVLRALAISMGMIVVGGSMTATVYILFLVRTLTLGPATIGLIAAFTGIGALIGAIMAGRVATRWTLGLAIVGAGFLESIAMLLTPAAALVPHAIPWLMLTTMLTGVAYSVLSINQISLRQRITPSHLLGRVTAGRRFLIFCMAPLGAVAGGWLGSSVGFETTLLAGGGVTLLASLYMWCSPIRTAT